MKLVVMTGTTNRKNLLTSGGDPVPDTDSGSLFHFSHHCRIRDFRIFISISHTVTSQFLPRDAMHSVDTFQNFSAQSSFDVTRQLKTRLPC